jgi:acetyl-CoA carboxylase biotin carboxylase subunit
MLKKVLIANRGEIALRIIRACREMGIQTVAVYSEADAQSLHVRFADEDVCIGPAPPAQSYLDPKRIISAAEVTNAEAIHPGYGFLAENAEFAEICESCGINFIGPPAEVIRDMGNKSLARQKMRAAGVPVTPGSEKDLTSVEEALELAAEIGYPVIIKAVAGGGGRGMRICENEKACRSNYEAAQAEAAVAFGNPAIYLEKYLQGPRHIEVQVLGDKHGNVIHLGERDCTVQRRHQKLIEESPSPAVNPVLRQALGEVAVQAAVAAGYYSTGTVEFLLDGSGGLYFMEMNTRIQVEHPVTEEQTDIDLFKEQIRVAAGEKLELTQADVTFEGHSIELRINAEDPWRNFAPRPGQITSFHVPGGHGIRVDTHAYAKYVIPPYYDSLIAKLIAHGKTRDEALRKLRRALDEFIVEGVPTTIDFYKYVIDHEVFISGEYDTSFVERHLPEIIRAHGSEKPGVKADSTS